jgi:hypothetical protein
MNKKTIDMVAIQPHKANAQSLTCFGAFVAAASFSALIMIVAILLPVMCTPTAVVCWMSMLLEASSVVFGYIAWWIKTKAM